MKRQTLSIGLVAAAFALTAGPVGAQDRGRPQGEQQASRPSSGDTVGSAVPRGSGGGSSSSGASSSGGTVSSSSGSSGSSSAGSSSPWVASPARERAPVRPDRVERSEQAQRRRPGGSSGEASGRAVPRGESGGSGGSGGSGSTSATAGSDNQPAQGRSRAVPTYSRPRDGRGSVGTAVERTGPIPDRDRNNYRRGYYYDPYRSLYYDPYYSGRYSYWSPFGYGYGLGYFSYDPFLFSGYGYPGYYDAYDPYAGGGVGYGSRYSQVYRGSGSLRLKVDPSHAEVYVDGYYVGVVDSFDGIFQRLSVEAGPHRVELRADGFEPVEFEVMVTPGDTITYKGEMKSR